MIMDAYLLFEPITGTAVAASGASTNVLDMSVGRDMGVGQYPIRVKVDQTVIYAGITSLNVAIQSSPDGTTWTTEAETSPMTQAQLTTQGIGRLWDTALPVRPVGYGASQPRYYRLYYTFVGTPTAGALNGEMVLDTFHSTAYPAGTVIYN